MKKTERNSDWKPIIISFPNGETLKLSYDKNTKFLTLFQSACVFSQINDHEQDYFGLSIFDDNFHHFMELNKKVSKVDFKSLLKKSGLFRTSSELSVNGLVESTNIPTLWFRVQFYVKPHVIKNRHAKICYYEQIKQNLLTHKFMYREDVYFQLAGLALHIDFGNYSIMLRHDRYFNPKKYFPHWLVARHGVCYLQRHVPSLHQSHSDLSRYQALNYFLQLASLPTSNFNMHLCRLLERTPFSSASRIPVWIGIAPEGIIYHEENEGNFISVINKFPWSDVSKLTHKKRMVEISLSSDRHLSLESVSSQQAFHLFHICEKMHMFQTATQMSRTKIPDSPSPPDRLKYRESYIFVNEEDLQKCQLSDFNQLSFRSFLNGNYCHLMNGRPISSAPAHDEAKDEENLNYYSLPNRKHRHRPRPINSTIMEPTILDESKLFGDCRIDCADNSSFSEQEENIDVTNLQEHDQNLQESKFSSISSQSPVTSGLGSSTSLTIHSPSCQPNIEFPPPPSSDEESSNHSIGGNPSSKHNSFQFQNPAPIVTFSENFLRKRFPKL